MTGSVSGTYQPDGRTTDPLVALDTDARTAMLSSFIGIFNVAWPVSPRSGRIIRCFTKCRFAFVQLFLPEGRGCGGMGRVRHMQHIDVLFRSDG